MPRMFSPTQAAGDMSDGYTQPPPDIYWVRCEEIELKTSSSSGKPYYEATLRVVHGEFENCKFWDNFSLTEKALWRLGEFSVSAGNQVDWDIESESETKRLLKGRVAKARTKWEEYEGVKRTKVQKWLLPEDDERPRMQQFEQRGGGASSQLPDGPSTGNAGPSGPSGASNAPNGGGSRARDDVPF